MVWLKVRRFLGWVLLAPIAVLGVVLASMPVWFPWAVSPVLHRYGVQYESHERMGYRRLVLHRARVQAGRTEALADRVEIMLPTVWFWRHAFGYDGTIALVVARDWRVDLTADRPAGPQSPQGQVDSVAAVLDAIDSALPRVRAWLSSARLVDGAVILGRGTVEVPWVEWDGRQVRVQAASARLGQTVEAGLDLSAPADWRLQAEAGPSGASLQSRISRSGSGWGVEGALLWQDNRVALASFFGAGRWPPSEASLDAPAFRVPARWLGLDPYGDLTGSLHLVWLQDQVVVRATAHADPIQDALPPLDLEVAASGGADAVAVETLDVNTPWFQAELADPFRLERTAQNWRVTPATLHLQCDLERLPVGGARGRLTGTVRIEPSQERVPRAVVAVTGEDLSVQGTAIRGGRAEAAVEWPRVKVLHAEFSLADHLAVTASGTVDVPSKGVSDLALRVVRNRASLEAAGGALLGERSVISLDRLTYRSEGREVYHLTAPCQVSVGQGGVVGLDAMHLEGEGRVIRLAGAVAWPQQGRVQVNGQGVPLRDLEGWIGSPLPDVLLEDLVLSASWDHGPASVVGTARAQWSRQAGRPVPIRIEGTADESGISLQRVSVMGELSEVVAVHGHVPVTVVPAEWPRPWQELAGSPLRLEALVRPDPAVTQELLEQIGIPMVGPEVRLTLSGSLAEPQGRVEAKASRIDLGPLLGRPDLPVLDEVTLEAAIRRDCVTLHALSMEVEGQAVQATGECPVPEGYWAGLLSAPSLPDWRTAAGRLIIDQARIEAFRQAGGVLLPLGSASVDMALHPGGLWDGQLTLAGAATRALGALPAIRDIQARVRLEGRSARIEEWTAHVGGQPVTMTGWARWTDVNDPEYELALEGQNVPLVRQAGLILRSDVDLQVVQARERPAQVTGKVTLRDSLYLRDLRLLVPSGEGQSSHRPPYFSVAEGPLADWRVALQVQGDRFMQVRTPWFSGEVSADFHVQGTLREPIATGEAWVDSGEVRFPFVDFQVDRGLVELTLANPYEPTLDLSATGQGYGHTLKLSVTGPAAQPLLSFTSTPALTSESILLLVTAGALPTGGATLTAAQRVSQVAGFFARDLWRRVSLDDEAPDRLSIRSGEDLTVTGQPTRTIEYELNDRWSLYGEYDRFNQVNAGLKWKVYSR